MRYSGVSSGHDKFPYYRKNVIFNIYYRKWLKLWIMVAYKKYSLNGRTNTITIFVTLWLELLGIIIHIEKIYMAGVAWRSTPFHLCTSPIPNFLKHDRHMYVLIYFITVILSSSFILRFESYGLWCISLNIHLRSFIRQPLAFFENLNHFQLTKSRLVYSAYVKIRHHFFM